MNKRLLLAVAALWIVPCVHSVRAEQPQAWKMMMAGAPSTLQAFRLNTATGQTWQKAGTSWKLMAESAPPFAGDLGTYECSMFAANSGVWALRWNRNTGDAWILRDNGWNKTQFDTPPVAGATPGAWQIAGDNTEANLVAVLLNTVTGQGWQLSSGNWTTLGDPTLLPAGTAGTYTCHVQDAPNGWWALRTNLKTGQSWRLASNSWAPIAQDVGPSADSAAAGLWDAEMSGSGGAMGAVVFSAATGQTWQWADTCRLIPDPAPLPTAKTAMYDVRIYDGPDASLALRWNTQTGQSWLMQNSAWQEMQYALLPVGDAGAGPSAWEVMLTGPTKYVGALLLNTATGQSWKRAQAQWLPLADNPPPPAASPGDYRASIRNLGDNWTGIRWNAKTGQSWLLAADAWTEMKFDQPPGTPLDMSAPWKVTLVGNGTDAEAILLNTAAGQAWRKSAGGWATIGDTARPAAAAAGTYQCSAYEETAGWAAVRWNATTGDSWILGPGSWQQMPAEQPPPPPANAIQPLPAGLLPPATK